MRTRVISCCRREYIDINENNYLMLNKFQIKCVGNNCDMNIKRVFCFLPTNCIIDGLSDDFKLSSFTITCYNNYTERAKTCIRISSCIFEYNLSLNLLNYIKRCIESMSNILYISCILCFVFFMVYSILYMIYSTLYITTYQQLQTVSSTTV